LGTWREHVIYIYTSYIPAKIQPWNLLGYQDQADMKKKKQKKNPNRLLLLPWV
jgi:hypothetical protein